MGTNITGIGNANAIGFKSRVTGGMYFPPELKDALVGVWSAYGKSNNSTDRNIIKNKIKDKGGDFVISNAAYKLNSGFGKYEEDFDSWIPNYNVATLTYTPSKLHITSVVNGNAISYTRKATNAMKVEVTGMQSLELIYRYITGDDTWGTFRFDGDGIYELPASGTTTKTYYTGFSVLNYKGDCDITIEQIPSFEGALVTDGVDDLIVSQKTVQEMLGGSNEITVVSMIHQIELNSTHSKGFTNYIEKIDSTTSYVRTQSNVAGKTGIYGYTYNDATQLLINNILGDKNDYEKSLANAANIFSNSKFSVAGGINNTNTFSSVAWYWTFIANRVLTTDEINQVIAYYNLDRTLKPDILCNTIKQGITNENHAEFGDKLIDYSGNGRDIQLNNIAWKGDSGIGKYSADFESFDWAVGISQKQHNKATMSLNSRLCNHTAIEVDEMKVNIIGNITELIYWYIANPDDTTRSEIRLTSGINTLPKSYAKDDGQTYNIGFAYISGDSEITIEQIPSHAGALCLDGVDDFGKVTGMPIYKDYTVVADYERLKIDIGVDSDSPILSKSESTTLGAFMFNTISSSGDKVSYSFGRRNIINTDDTIRKIFYQSKYINDGQDINIESTFVDSDKLWLGTYRDSDYRFIEAAIYSLMSFPYSMSEFLIERQLKKHKLGTLYPNMVEFRPIVKSNSEYTITAFLGSTPMVIGSYYPINTPITFHVKPKGLVDEVVKLTINGKETVFNKVSGTTYIYDYSSLPKSPQKIDITIDEYIRYEDIVQPYPEMWVITQNAKKVSWGDKLKVGSEFGYNSKINLLSGLYSTANSYYNGKVVKAGDVLKVEKQMVFACDYSWIGGTNEPKCILSPSRLRIPNSSYKLLGYIPDISGHGNHGKINNSAYAGMSGANGYTEQTFSNWRYNTAEKRAEFTISNDVKLNIAKVIMARGAILYTLIGDYTTTNSIQRYKVTGVDENHPIVFGNDAPFDALLTVTTDGEYEVDWKTYGKNPCIFTTWTGDCNITIEQIGEYEGAYCLDGVDDFVTIPTTVGGKQVLMKVNSRKSDCYLYDQRNNWTQYLGIVSTKDFIAYNYSNQRGKTYIDGILNENITANDLIGITHNITVTNNRDDVKQYSPCIGTSFARNSYAQMALYDFMLFDEVSTDEEIKQLNDIIGIEGGYVERPEYYWDCFGKTNDDPDRDIITEQVSKDVANALSVKNAAFKLDSGFGKYEVDFLDTSIWHSSNSTITSSKIDCKNAISHIMPLYYNVGDKEYPDIPSFKIIKTGADIDYSYINETGFPGSVRIVDGVNVLPASHNTLYSGSGRFCGFGNPGIGNSVTIEQIPEYQNGLSLDGVDDYLENLNIPAFTDFTVIAKRVWVNKDNPANECFIHKGDIHTPIGKSAFMLEYEITNDTYYRSASFSGYINVERVNRPESITYQTTKSYNGIPIIKGSGIDTKGLVIGAVTNNYWKGIFYKLMLYPRTTNMLTINMIKNMMAEDGIIDLTSKLFTDKFTGDFNLDFNKDFLIGN